MPENDTPQDDQAGAPADEVTPDAPADSTPAVDAATDDTAEAGTAGEPEGAVEFVLPEDYTSYDDDRLVGLHASLDQQIAEGRDAVAAKAAAGEATLADVATLKSLRAAQQTIADTLAARVADRQAIADGLNELENPVPLPDAVPARAAAAKAVTRVISEQPPTPDQAPADQTPSEVTAAAAEQPMPWRSVRDGGSSASWGDLVNEGRRNLGSTVDPMRPVVLASARVIDDEDRMLTDSASKNERLIGEAMEEHRAARMEAGGGARLAAICDPATILRDAFVCGTTATPLQSSLVNMTANSGNALKYEYRLPTSIAAATAGIATWDVADQNSVDPTDPETWKPTVAIACASYSTEVASEQTASYEVDAFTELSSPESVDDFVQAKDRAFARHTEGWYLRKLDTFLHPLTWDASAGAGAVPEIIEMVLTALANGHYGERLDLASGYAVYGSPGLLYALAADENRKGYRSGSTDLAAVQSLVEGATGTSYVQLLDVAHTDGNGTWGSSPFAALPAVGGSAAALARLDSLSFTLRIIDPSSFVAFTTGEATFGEQVTLDQARQNKRGFFQRMFGGLMKPGCAPGFKITVTGLAVDGSRGGFLTPDAELTS